MDKGFIDVLQILHFNIIAKILNKMLFQNYFKFMIFVIDNQRLMRPISKLKHSLVSQELFGQSQRLHQLRKSLSLNLKAQQKLRKIRDDISIRLHNLDEFISTYRLRTEYPPATGILSYLKFQRSTPNSLKEQSKVIQMQEAIKNSNEDDFQFMKKLNQNKPSKKKKEINFNQLPKQGLKINFIELAYSSAQYKTGMQVYKAWLDHNKVKMPKRPYTNLEEEIIIEKQKMYKDNWEKICQFIENRTFQQIYYQFHNRINPKMRTGRWTLRQTMMLIILLEHYGLKRWALIAEKMQVKSQLQVRQRFCNIIDPSLGKNLWTPQMEDKLLDIVKYSNYSWKEIAKTPCFGNKTDNAVWRKFRNIMIKRSRQQIIDFMKDCQKKDLVEKILKYKELVDTKKAKSQMKIKQKREALLKKEKQLTSKNRTNKKNTINTIIFKEQDEIKKLQDERMNLSNEMKEQKDMIEDQRMDLMMY